MKYLIRNCSIIDGTKDMQVQENCDLYINDGIIEKIAKHSDKANNDYNVIDGTGKFVMPGLINLHAHMFGTGKPSKVLGGGSLQKKLIAFINTPLGNKVADLLVASSAKVALMSGVTTIRSVGDFVYSDVRVRDKINSGKMIGPRMIVSGPAITAIGGHGYGTFAICSNDEDELRKLVRQNVEHNVDFIKTCSTGGVMDAKNLGEPAEMKMNQAQLNAVVDEAHKLGKIVASHTESPMGVEYDLIAGVDTIEHGAPVSKEVVQMYKDKGSAYVLTLSPALPLAKLSHEETKLNPVAESVAKIVFQNMIDGGKQAIEEGISFGIGTDCSCPMVTQYNMWRELAYLEKFLGVTPAFAIHTATLANANICGIGNQTGSIEVGKSADIIMLEKDPLKDLRALANVKGVMIKGKYIAKPCVKKNKSIEETLDRLLAQ